MVRSLHTSPVACLLQKEIGMQEGTGPQIEEVRVYAMQNRILGGIVIVDERVW